MPASYETQAYNLWVTFKNAVAPGTTTQAQWDAACESYLNAMETLNVAFGHPAGRPRARP
jgi:hypothetical protein